MALQSLTTDTRNPILGMIGQGPLPEAPGLPHLNELLPDIASPDSPTGLQALSSAPQPIDPLQQRKHEVEADLERRMNPTKPTSVMGKIGHGFATAGNILGDIFAPSTMALIPGTQLNNEMRKNDDRSQLGEISDLETAQAGRKATQATTDYTEQRPEIEKAKLLQKLTSSLAPKGIIPTMNPDGTIDTEQDPNSPYVKKMAAATELAQAQAERQQVMAQMGQPGTPLYEQNQHKLDQIDQRIHASLEGVGLRKEMIGVLAQRNAIQAGRLNLEQDKNYNPEPTGAERTKGGLADSAVHQIQVMNNIISKRPDQFGPGAGSATQFNTWLGSEDPDAAAYNAAQTYLAEHSAGVFGGRSAYIMKHLQGLTNQRQNPDALKATLKEAQDTAQLFVNKGTIHAQGEKGAAAGGNPAGPKEGETKKNSHGDEIVYRNGAWGLK